MKRKKQDPSSGADGSDLVPRDSAQGPEATFEEAFAVVENAVEQLERGDLPLEESLAEYEKGLKSFQRCHSILDRAQKRIEVLSEVVGSRGDASPEPEWRPGASNAALRETIESIDDEEDVPRGS